MVKMAAFRRGRCHGPQSGSGGRGELMALLIFHLSQGRADRNGEVRSSQQLIQPLRAM